MIDELKKHNTLAAQLFYERMVTQTEAQSKQINFLVEKTKVMFKYGRDRCN